MSQTYDTFLQNGPPFEIRLIHSLGYPAAVVGEDIFMSGRKITAWAADVPICSTVIRTESPRARRVEYFCPYTRSWETIARGPSDEMDTNEVIESLQAKLEETRERHNVAKNMLPDQARMNAVGFSEGIAQIFVVMSDEKLKSLENGRPALLQYRGSIPFPADLYILPPVKA